MKRTHSVDMYRVETPCCSRFDWVVHLVSLPIRGCSREGRTSKLTNRKCIIKQRANCTYEQVRLPLLYMSQPARNIAPRLILVVALGCPSSGTSPKTLALALCAAGRAPPAGPVGVPTVDEEADEGRGAILRRAI